MIDGQIYTYCRWRQTHCVALTIRDLDSTISSGNSRKYTTKKFSPETDAFKLVINISVNWNLPKGRQFDRQAVFILIPSGQVSIYEDTKTKSKQVVFGTQVPSVYQKGASVCGWMAWGPCKWRQVAQRERSYFTRMTFKLVITILVYWHITIWQATVAKFKWKSFI